MDHEEQDGRTPAQLLRLARQLADDAHRHGFLYGAYTNAWNAWGGQATGFHREVMDAVHDAADFLTVMAYGGCPEGDVVKAVEDQLSYLSRPDFSKLLLTVEEGSDSGREAAAGGGGECASGARPTVSLSDARRLHELLVDGVHNFSGVVFWPNRAGKGGPLSAPHNRKIAAVLGLSH